MSAFDLQKSIENARRRLGDVDRPVRAPRSDRGRLRLPAGVVAAVAEELSGQERPRMRDLLAGLRRRCEERGLEPPSRATVYKLMRDLPGPTVRKADLPPAVRATLYDLDAESEIPLHHIAFHCFNYGGLEAISYGAGLPWLAIYQALRTRGHRPKSRGLIEAVALVRGI